MRWWVSDEMMRWLMVDEDEMVELNKQKNICLAIYHLIYHLISSHQPSHLISVPSHHPPFNLPSHNLPSHNLPSHNLPSPNLMPLRDEKVGSIKWDEIDHGMRFPLSCSIEMVDEMVSEMVDGRWWMRWWLEMRRW